MDKFIKIFLLAALIKASSLYSAMGPEDEQEWPRLVHIAVEKGGFKEALDSMESSDAFKAIKEHAGHPSVTGQFKGNEATLNKVVGKFYFYLFEKEGGWEKASLLTKTDPFTSRDAPLIVKALHNSAIRFYKADNEDQTSCVSEERGRKA